MNIDYLDWFANIIRCQFHFALINSESIFLKNETRTELGRSEVGTTCCQIQLEKGRGLADANTATEGRLNRRPGFLHSFSRPETPGPGVPVLLLDLRLTKHGGQDEN